MNPLTAHNRLHGTLGRVLDPLQSLLPAGPGIIVKSQAHDQQGKKS